MDIGKAIKTIRKKRGIKQGELAESMGITRTGLYLIESGRRDVSKKTIQIASKALKVPLSSIILEAITEEDLPSTSIYTYKALQQPIIDLLERNWSPLK